MISAQEAEKKGVIERNEVAARIKELEQFIQQEETKKVKKREDLVKGFDEGTLNFLIKKCSFGSFLGRSRVKSKYKCG